MKDLRLSYELLEPFLMAVEPYKLIFEVFEWSARHECIRLCMMHMLLDHPRSFDHTISELAFDDA